MTPDTHFDGSALFWLTIVIVIAIVAVFAIKAFAAMRVAKSNFGAEQAKSRITTLELEQAEMKTRLAAVERLLSDV